MTEMQRHLGYLHTEIFPTSWIVFGICAPYKFISSLQKKLEGQWDAPVGKDTFCQAWQPGFNPRDLRGGKREPSLANRVCPLT